MSATFEDTFERMLGAVATDATMLDVPLVPFWPLRGANYDRELLIIGRSVNGWVDDWTAGQLRDPDQRALAVTAIRQDAEPPDHDRMAWVTELWGATTGYNTRRSAFWRAVRRISAGDDAAPDWPGRLAWTNLYKVSPAAGWNPGGDLQRAQRLFAVTLLQLELAELQPRRVLALTGDWIRPFVGELGLDLERPSGLVEMLGHAGGRTCVVAKHPMGKPGDAFVDEVRRAFAELGMSVAEQT